MPTKGNDFNSMTKQPPVLAAINSKPVVIRNMADIVEDLEKSLGAYSDKAQAAALEQLGFGVKTVGVIQSLIGYSGQLREIEDDLGQVVDLIA